jgi:hypothetical protein
LDSSHNPSVISISNRQNNVVPKRSYKLVKTFLRRVRIGEFHMREG